MYAPDPPMPKVATADIAQVVARELIARSGKASGCSLRAARASKGDLT
jgi:hypothetical protein